MTVRGAASLPSLQLSALTEPALLHRKLPSLADRPDKNEHLVPSNDQHWAVINQLHRDLYGRGSTDTSDLPMTHRDPPKTWTENKSSLKKNSSFQIFSKSWVSLFGAHSIGQDFQPAADEFLAPLRDWRICKSDAQGVSQPHAPHVRYMCNHFDSEILLRHQSYPPACLPLQNLYNVFIVVRKSLQKKLEVRESPWKRVKWGE